jgi:hypothetical protein
MKDKLMIEKLIYAPDEISGKWELWASGEDQYGNSFFKEVDLEDVNRQATEQGCSEYSIHLVVPAPDNTIDLFVFDENEKKNKIINAEYKFKTSQDEN